MIDENELTAEAKLAIQKQIDISTFVQLKEMCAEVGIKVAPRHKEDTLRKLLLAHFGMSMDASTPDLPKIKSKSGDDGIFPPYNLSANGLWQGKRYIVRLRKNQDVGKVARAEPFSWNGKAPYWLSYEETASIPAPIYFALLENTRHTARQEKNAEGEVTTVFDIDRRYVFDDKGVDPATAHLANSLTEWYRMKGPEWFTKRSHRELQQICSAVDVKYLDREQKALPLDDLTARLLTHFFGYADAEAA